MFKWFLKRPLAIAFAAVVFFFLWLAFRPELLFVNKSVDEPFPTSTPAVTNSSPQRH
jgi:hypothetical protein